MLQRTEKIVHNTHSWTQPDRKVMLHTWTTMLCHWHLQLAFLRAMTAVVSFCTRCSDVQPTTTLRHRRCCPHRRAGPADSKRHRDCGVPGVADVPPRQRPHGSVVAGGSSNGNPELDVHYRRSCSRRAGGKLQKFMSVPGTHQRRVRATSFVPAEGCPRECLFWLTPLAPSSWLARVAGPCSCVFVWYI